MATDHTTFLVAGLPEVVLALDGTAAAVEATDAGSLASKRAAVLSCTVNGQAVVLLVRVQKAPNGLFLDVVAAESVAALDTAAGNMDLSAEVPAHPSPDEDAVDTAVLAAAA